MKISGRCDSVAHTSRNQITANVAKTLRLDDSLCAFAILRWPRRHLPTVKKCPPFFSYCERLLHAAIWQSHFANWKRCAINRRSRLRPLAQNVLREDFAFCFGALGIPVRYTADFPWKDSPHCRHCDGGTREFPFSSLMQLSYACLYIPRDRNRLFRFVTNVTSRIVNTDCSAAYFESETGVYPALATIHGPIMIVADFPDGSVAYILLPYCRPA
jgi:hypothetical protein